MTEFLENKRFYNTYILALVALVFACYFKLMNGLLEKQQFIFTIASIAIFFGSFIWYQSYVLKCHKVKMLCTSVTALLIMTTLYGIPTELSPFKIPHSVTGLSTIGRIVIENWSSYFDIPLTERFFGSFLFLFIFVLLFPTALIGIATSFKRAVVGFLITAVSSIILILAFAFAYSKIFDL